jgi:cytochrome c oxidase subunit 1
MFAGFYFWWPKWTGRMLNERLGMVHFWTLFIGFHMTFLIQHWLGVDGMVRRYADYSAADGWTFGNQVSTVGAMILGASMIPFFLNVWLTARTAPKVTVNDPWGYGASLEWATSCPPPRHNFTSILHGNVNERGDDDGSPGKSYLFFLTVHHPEISLSGARV